MGICYSSSGKLIDFLSLLFFTAISTVCHVLFAWSLVSLCRMSVQGVYLLCSLFTRINKNMLNCEPMWAAQVTSCVFPFESHSVGGFWVLLLQSLHRLAKIMLLLTHLSTSPYDHVVTGNTWVLQKSFKKPPIWDVAIHENTTVIQYSNYVEFSMKNSTLKKLPKKMVFAIYC